MSDTGPYDVIVVGVGGIGSATTYHLAQRGANVLGLERFNIPHEKGSSFGTRIILPAGHRPSAESLNQRAYTLWKELEEKTDRQLLYRTGSLGISVGEGQQFEGELEACKHHDVDYEVLTGSEVSTRFPAYNLPSDSKAIFQPKGGFLDCEQCVTAHAEAAHQDGAEIHARERVTDWNSTSNGVEVTTDRDAYEADTLVITAGAWAGNLVDSLRDLLTPELHLTARFQPTVPGQFTPENFPVFSMTTADGSFCYGTPIHQKPGFKFARGEAVKSPIDPNQPQQKPSVEDESAIQTVARQYFPEGVESTLGLKTGYITWTAKRSDSNPILDTLPEAENVVIGAGFSGGGFSTAPVTGEILADLAFDNRTSYGTEQFSISRLC